MDRRALYVDVDDTLLLHDKSQYPDYQHITVGCNGREFVGVAHAKNIKLLIKFWKLGYEVYVWSKTGKSWAEAVCRALSLEMYVSAYLTKPDFYMDDKGANEWLGPRVYRDPKTGEEK